MTINVLHAMEVSCLIFPLQKLLFFDLTCHLVEIAYICSPTPKRVHGLSSSIRIEKEYVDLSGSPYYRDHVRLLRNVIFCTSRRFSRCSWVADVEESGYLACTTHSAENEALRDQPSKRSWENGDAMCQTMGRARAPARQKKKQKNMRTVKMRNTC